MNSSSEVRGNPLQLTLATGAFAVCFAVFGSVSAMMPILKKNLALDPVQVSIALAIPVLLGSLGRIPLGILTDRFGGRTVFSAVMAVSIIPALLMGWLQSYTQLLIYGFFIGIALAWGVAFTNFDAALVGYTFAVLFATFAITYRYSIWLQLWLLTATMNAFLGGDRTASPLWSAAPWVFCSMSGSSGISI